MTTHNYVFVADKIHCPKCGEYFEAQATVILLDQGDPSSGTPIVNCLKCQATLKVVTEVALSEISEDE